MEFGGNRWAGGLGHKNARAASEWETRKTQRLEFDHRDASAGSFDALGDAVEITAVGRTDEVEGEVYLFGRDLAKMPGQDRAADQWSSNAANRSAACHRY